MDSTILPPEDRQFTIYLDQHLSGTEAQVLATFTSRRDAIEAARVVRLLANRLYAAGAPAHAVIVQHNKTGFAQRVDETNE